MFITHTPDFKEEPSCLLEKEMTTHSSILAWEIPWTVAYLATVHMVTRIRQDLATKPSPPSPPPLFLSIFSKSLFRKCIFFLKGDVIGLCLFLVTSTFLAAPLISIQGS